MGNNYRRKTAISLFTGAGGMDVGFAASGFNIIMANDIDNDSCETYRKNHKAAIYHEDIDDFLKKLPCDSTIDLVFGGPPCQGFSVAGKMDPKDERNTLMRRFLDVVERVRPRAFVCENVKALAVLGKWESFRERIIKRAEGIGYKCGLIIINSADYGVPQSRERMFLVGFSDPANRLGITSIKDALLTMLAAHNEAPPTIRQVLTRLGRAACSGNRRICKAKVTFAKNPVMRRSPYAGMLFNGAGRPLRADGYSSTLPASMGGNKTPIVDEGHIYASKPSWVEKYHRYLKRGGKPYKGDAPKRLRRLTIDECLAIQTFPKGYKLFGKQSSMYRQIGNAVPCKLAKAVALVVAEVLDRDSKYLRATAKRVRQTQVEFAASLPSRMEAL